MKHRAMEEEQHRLEALIQSMLEEAAQADAAEDARFGKGQREPMLPPELASAQGRLEKLREAQRVLESEAQQRLQEADYPSQKRGRPPKGSPPSMNSTARSKRKERRKRARRNAVAPVRSYNFTDPDARMMHDNGSKRIVTGYNAQLAVDAEYQVIVAAELTQQANDLQQLLPMTDALKHAAGALPEALLADAGYWDTLSMEHRVFQAVRLLVSPDAGPGWQQTRMLHHPLAQRMREALRDPVGRALYRLRQTTVEPVIGRIKEIRRFRRTSFRGLSKVSAEWKLVCLTHNLLKLHRWAPRPA